MLSLSADDRGVIDERGRDLDIVIGHHAAAVENLVNMHERREWHSALVRDSRLNIEGVHLEEQPRHLLEWGGKAPES